MGKMMYLLSCLVIADILFIMVGALTPTDIQSLSSILLNFVLNLSDFNVTLAFTQFIGDFSNLGSSLTGLASLGVGLGIVAVGTYFAPTDTKLFIPMGIVLGAIGSDFVIYYHKIYVYNPFLAVLIFGPLMLVHIFTVIEWVRGRD